MPRDFSSADAWRQSLKKKLARGSERLELLSAGDRRFFDRHKHRNHRLRPAAPIEIEQADILAGPPPAERRGMRWFTLVKQFAPGMRGRALVSLPEAAEDISEQECDGIFAQAFAEIREDAALEAQRCSDAEWFENNPHRALRARPMTAAERAVFWPCPIESGYSVVIAKIGKLYSKHAVRFAPAVTARLDAMSDREILAATPKGGS